jgi:hypothetical protein
VLRLVREAFEVSQVAEAEEGKRTEVSGQMKMVWTSWVDMSTRTLSPVCQWTAEDARVALSTLLRKKC